MQSALATMGRKKRDETIVRKKGETMVIKRKVIMKLSCDDGAVENN